MNAFARIAVAAAVAAAGYLTAWPVPIDPEAWTPTADPGFTGPYAPNEALAGIARIDTGPHRAPEDIAFDADGNLWAGTLDGALLRRPPGATDWQVVVNTGGRPLGLKWHPAGEMIVADAERGLLAVKPDGSVRVLATEAGGRRLGFTDDLDIGADGTIYFSDASRKFGFKDVMNDFLEHGPNGRLLAFDPRTGATRVLEDGLYFANGVAVAADQASVLVVESSAYRVRRHWLAGPKAGRSEIFIDALPGVPDGILGDGHGGYWIAMPTPRPDNLDTMLPHPWLRRIIARLPEALHPKPAHMAFAIEVDADGRVRHALQDPQGRTYAMITNVVERDGKLYLGSLSEAAVGVVAAPR